jgi:hypothetical protein
MALTNTPEKTSISPNKIKRGIGRRTKVLIDEKILCTSWDNPVPPPQMMYMNTTLIAIKDRKTGNPIANKTKNNPIINVNHIHHSIFVSPLWRLSFLFFQP